MAERVHIDRVVSLWEPLMIVAARIREALGVPGMTVEETVPFRDKERMKQLLDAAGIRTPRHARARSVAEVRAAIEAHRLPGDPQADRRRRLGRHATAWTITRALERALAQLGHVDEVSVEEFIDGEEYHVRHRLRRRARCSSRTSAGTGRGR